MQSKLKRHSANAYDMQIRKFFCPELPLDWIATATVPCPCLIVVSRPFDSFSKFTYIIKLKLKLKLMKSERGKRRGKIKRVQKTT